MRKTLAGRTAVTAATDVSGSPDDITAVVNRILSAPAPVEKTGVPGKRRRRGDVRGQRPRARTLRNRAAEQAAGPPSGAAEGGLPFVRAFEQLFRAFRRQAYEHLGRKCEAAFIGAEKRVRLLNPDFDSHALNRVTAPITLELVSEIVSGASFFRRAKLKRAALALISDLYNKQYTMLEANGAIDTLEQTYYRLKG